jgi:hypothetical protein
VAATLPLTRAWYNPGMASAVSYTVSGTHPKTRRYHAESFSTPKEALAKADELRQSGYENVTIRSSMETPDLSK